MKRQLDIDKGRECLHRQSVLRDIEEVSQAALELRVPFEDVELWVGGPMIDVGGAAVFGERRRLEGL